MYKYLFLCFIKDRDQTVGGVCAQVSILFCDNYKTAREIVEYVCQADGYFLQDTTDVCAPIGDDASDLLKS